VLLEGFVGMFNGLLDDFVGPAGRKYLPIVGSLFLLILICNLGGHGSGTDGAHRAT
jgi:F0F1-type ATP synthase membrane subunit a